MTYREVEEEETKYEIGALSSYLVSLAICITGTSPTSTASAPTPDFHCWHISRCCCFRQFTSLSSPLNDHRFFYLPSQIGKIGSMVSNNTKSRYSLDKLRGQRPCACVEPAEHALTTVTHHQDRVGFILNLIEYTIVLVLEPTREATCHIFF